MDDSNKPDQSLKKNNEKSVLRTISSILGLAIIYFGFIAVIYVGGTIPSLLVWVGAVFLGMIIIVLGRERGLIVKVENKRLKIGTYKYYKENVKPDTVGIIASLFTFFCGIIVFFLGYVIGGFLGTNSMTGEVTYPSIAYPIWAVALFISIILFVVGVIGLMLSLQKHHY